MPSSGTLILGPRPPEVEALIERRRRLGHDGHDEVWEGVYHVTPHAHSRHGVLETEVALALAPRCKALGLTYTGAFNLGDSKDDFRVPDFGVHTTRPNALYVPSAVIVGEVLSPDDQTFEKIPFYRIRGVRELFIVDPDQRTIDVHHLDEVVHVDTCSDYLDLDLEEVQAEIDWP